MVARSRSPVRPRPCFCNQPAWCKLLSRSVSGTTIDDLAQKKIPKKVSATIATGAAQLRAYTSCAYCSDLALACGEKEPVEIPIAHRSSSSQRESAETLLDCPFAQKDQAKQLGARWNPSLQKWYVPAGQPTAPFARWLPQSSRVPVSSGITCGQIWAKLQQLAQGGTSDFEVSGTGSGCYVDRIILAGSIVVVEMTSRPMPPFHSCMVRGSDEAGDGSVTRPVRTDERAEELAVQLRSDTCAKCFSCFPEHAYDFEMQVKVNCSSPACQLLPCNEPDCEQKVCAQHGGGLGSFHASNEDDIVYKRRGCMVEGCDIAYCERHLRGKFQVCDVCYNGTAATISLVGDGGFPETSMFYLCQAHGTRCDKKMSGLGDSDDNDEDGDEICNFVCCPSCLLSHRCGDDPTEYV